MKTKEVTIINFGMGNIWSVSSAFEYLGCKVRITSDKKELKNSDALILPGVGSFKLAMERIQKLDLHDEIVETVKVNGVKILGICLGMQLFAESGTENGFRTGLNILPLEVADFSFKNSKQIKIPHIGFNQVDSMEDSILFNNLPRKADFYFVHSYRMLSKLQDGTSATTLYGEKFLAAYEHENVFATQFHPEKSQTNGLTLLNNFLKA